MSELSLGKSRKKSPLGVDETIYPEFTVPYCCPAPSELDRFELTF